jgi:uroporphyrinogen-III synthase
LPTSDGVLLTRPEPEAEETARRLRALGFRPILAPALSVTLHGPRRPDRAQAVLVTSGNALPGVPAELRRLPLLAVGDATAVRARAAGFADVRSASGDAAALVDMARRDLRPGHGTLLLACGEGQGTQTMEALRAHGFEVDRRIVYAALAVVDLPPAAAAALRDGAVRAALFFSAASARATLAQLRRAGLEAAVRTVDACAISATTEAALAPLPWRSIRVASRPDQDGLLACLTP